jgi:hypothetical protein
MDLTWNIVEQYVFLAAIVAIVLGMGKALITMFALWRHLSKNKGKGTEYAKDRKKAVTRTIFEGLVEITTGAFTILIFVFIPGIFSNEGRSIVIILGIIFLALSAMLWVAANWFLEGLESAK